MNWGALPCLFALGLAACNAPSPKASAAAPSASVSAAAAPVKPALEGTFRCEAIVASNDKAVTELGAKRVEVLAALRASADKLTLVTGRMSWTFHEQQLVVRFESVFRFVDGAYSWSRCEGQGAVEWNGASLKVPAEIATRGESGTFTEKDHRSGSCNANVAAGQYQIEREGGELIVRGERDGARFGFVLVPDESKLDLAGEAKRLAGNTQ